MKLALIALVVTLSTPALAANRLSIRAQQAGLDSEEIAVPVLLDTDFPVFGFQLSIAVDTREFRIERLELEGTESDGAEFSAGEIAADGSSIHWGVLLEASEPFDRTAIEPGAGQVIARLVLRVVATSPRTAIVRFEDIEGAPSAKNKIVREEGDEIPVETADGRITLTETTSDVFTLGFSGPPELAGAPGGNAPGEYFCTLEHSGDGSGAEAWSIGVTLAGGEITGIGLEGTTAADAVTDSFEIHDLTTGEGNEGAISAVVVSLTTPEVLPPRTAHTIARLTLEAAIPPAGGEATLRYVDGLVGAAQPVENFITQDNDTIIPELEELDIVLVARGVTFRRGDANADRLVNISDPTFTLGFLFLGDDEGFDCEKAADANDDGAINLSDAVYTLNFLFTGGDSIPPPIGACGIDPTDDPLPCEAFPPCG